MFKEIYEKIINDKKIIDRYENIRKFEDKTGGWAYHDLNHIKRVEKIIDNVLNKIEFDEEFIYKEKIAWCLTHAKRLMTIEPERIAMSQMRGHAPWYIKGLKNSSAVKNELSKVNTYEELEKILKDYEQFLDTL